MVINELEKSIWKEIILDNFLTYMLRDFFWNPTKKYDYDMDIISLTINTHTRTQTEEDRNLGR
jgi:hypothetical protein